MEELAKLEEERGTPGYEVDACWGGVCDRRGDFGECGDCVEDGVI